MSFNSSRGTSGAAENSVSYFIFLNLTPVPPSNGNTVSDPSLWREHGPILCQVSKSVADTGTKL